MDGDIEDALRPAVSPYQVDRLISEGGEGGKASQNTEKQEQPDFVGPPFPIFAYASQKTYSETAENVYCHGTVGHPVFVEKSLHAGTDEIPQTGSDKSAGAYK